MPKILIISGTLEDSFHPVPPIADGAPEWNVFRLAEAKGTLEIHVVSPCTKSQLPSLREFPARGNYHHIVFNDSSLTLYRLLLRHLLPLRLFVRRIVRLPDLVSWMYLHHVKSLLTALSPDLVVINARPQYIRYLRPLVPRGRLLLFMRGPMGESRRLLPLLDGIIVNSHGMADYAGEFVDREVVPIWQMPNSLGDEFVVPEAPPNRFSRLKKRIIFAGRIVPEKGVLQLLDAVEIIQEKLPEIELIICGAADNFKVSGPLTPYERQVRLRAAQIPAGRVRFLDYIPNTKIARFYVDSNLAVFPSICAESFGMVALEAMRCRTPVVASKRPGFEELVIHGKTGYLVDDPHDTGSLAAAMLNILKASDLARQMGEAGYARSLRYTPEVAIRKFEAIVEEALDRRSVSAATTHNIGSG